MKKRIVFNLIVVIILIAIISNNRIIINEIKTEIVKLTEEPINIETGTINNRYFNIYGDGKNSEETTRGINEAIKYASKNNIKSIKFEKGFYKVGNINTKGNVSRAIIMESNISIDWNGAHIEFVKNDKPVYAVISILGKDNIEIKNAILVGDKNEHIYDTDISKTHEWGNGVDIRGRK